MYHCADDFPCAWDETFDLTFFVLPDSENMNKLKCFVFYFLFIVRILSAQKIALEPY